MVLPVVRNRIDLCIRIYGKYGFGTITSFANKKVDVFRSLLGVDRKNKFNSSDFLVLEGHRHVIDSIERGLKPTFCLVSNRALSAPLGNTLSRLLSENGIDFELVDGGLIQKLSPSEHSQGVLAAVKRSSLPNYRDISSIGDDKYGCNHDSIASTVKLVQDSLDGNPLMLVLDCIQDPGNLGTLFRNAYGFGAGCIITIDGCHPLSPKAIRASLGTALASDLLTVSLHKEQLCRINSLIEGRDRDVYIVAAVVPEDTGELGTVHEFTAIQQLIENSRKGSTCAAPLLVLVLGSEACGISAATKQWLLAHAGSDRVKVLPATIPMWKRSVGFAGTLDSLNVANAGAILLCEMSRIAKFLREHC
jgi:tRNA G18 (ribose-2'-O)-methylase SpoU